MVMLTLGDVGVCEELAHTFVDLTYACVHVYCGFHFPDLDRPIACKVFLIPRSGERRLERGQDADWRSLQPKSPIIIAFRKYIV